MSLMGKRIKEKRKSIGLTQSELAIKVGLSIDSIKKLETGQRIPSVDTLKRLSDLFNCSTDYLLGRDDIEQKKKSVLEAYDALPPDKKKYVDDLVKMLSQKDGI